MMIPNETIRQMEAESAARLDAMAAAYEEKLATLKARLAEARLLLIKLSNEAGACSGMVGAREFLGNTNLACLELRVRKAREWLAAIDAARAADSALGVKK